MLYHAQCLLAGADTSTTKGVNLYSMQYEPHSVQHAQNCTRKQVHIEHKVTFWVLLCISSPQSRATSNIGQHGARRASCLAMIEQGMVGK